MTVVGLIAEYNPLHNGHLYQINKIKEELNPDHIILILGNNFTQRGEVSILNKYEKTKLALELGVSLVIELPTIFTCSSAEHFAYASVKLLNSLNVVTHLCFGAETDKIDDLEAVAKVLHKEDKEYKSLLKDELEKGISYPKARNNAILRYFKKSMSDEKANSILNGSNNILGIEYIKAILKLKSKIKPYLIKRIGPGENTNEIIDNISSASNIRNMLCDESNDSPNISENTKKTKKLNSIKKLVPKETFELLKEKSNLDFSIDSYSDLLLYMLRTKPSEYFENIHEVKEGNHISIINASKKFNTISDITIEAKSKRFTYTSISRTILNIILNITKKDFENAKVKFPRYIRVLGFREQDSKLLKLIEKNSKTPIVVNFNKFYKEQKNKDILELLENEMKYNNIYQIKTENDAFCDLTGKVIKL